VKRAECAGRFGEPRHFRQRKSSGRPARWRAFRYGRLRRVHRARCRTSCPAWQGSTRASRRCAVARQSSLGCPTCRSTRTARKWPSEVPPSTLAPPEMVDRVHCAAQAVLLLAAGHPGVSGDAHPSQMGALALPGGTSLAPDGSAWHSNSARISRWVRLWTTTRTHRKHCSASL
jgi:hypothetical protein